MLTRGLLKYPDSLLYQALVDDKWTLDQHLLALVFDQLGTANWQRSKDGAKNRNRPRPLSPLMKDRSVRYGKTDRKPEEVIAYLKRLNPQQYANGG